MVASSLFCKAIPLILIVRIIFPIEYWLVGYGEQILSLTSALRFSFMLP